MSIAPLTAISPIDGRYTTKLEILRPLFSEYALMKWRLTVEVHWLITLSLLPEINEIPPFPPQTEAELLKIIDNFTEESAARVKEIENVTNHDVKAIEYYLKECLSSHIELTPYLEFIHFACTSEDINNVAYAIMLRNARREVILPMLNDIHSQLARFAQQYAEIPMLARTHGQPASPTTLGKEFAVYVARLSRQLSTLQQVQILAKFNGAVGNYNAHTISYPAVDWLKVTREFIQSLDLAYNSHTTQIEPHDWIAEYCHALERINTILIDLCRDIWGYISIDYFSQKKVATEVGSSTMPHKVNPIDFENAEGNLGFANAMLAYFASRLPLSRMQRDLTDSTLLRNIGVAIGHTVLAYQSISKGLAKLMICEERISTDLSENWAVLAEAVQTVMRRYGVANPYEKLKELTRGEKITRSTLHQFILTLELPEHAKHELLELTPRSYLGKAKELAVNLT